MYVRLLCLASLVLGVALPCSGQAAEKVWKAGIARAVITPQKTVWLSGYAGRRVPTGAAAPVGPADQDLSPGTINIIVSVPVPLTDAALVNAVITVTEAKTQAVLDAGFAATGTATDAVCVAARDPAGTAAEDFAGPRSAWGARIARSVYAAVLAGATAYRASEAPREGT